MPEAARVPWEGEDREQPKLGSGLEEREDSQQQHEEHDDTKRQRERRR